MGALVIVVAIVVLLLLRAIFNEGRPLGEKPPLTPLAPSRSAPEATGPGRYLVKGVERATKMDKEWRVRADSAANAKVKAELEGIIVTSVESEQS